MLNDIFLRKFIVLNEHRVDSFGNFLTDIQFTLSFIFLIDIIGTRQNIDSIIGNRIYNLGTQYNDSSYFRCH